MMEDESRASLQLLTQLGALKPGPQPTVVTCTACDAGHSEVIKYDAERHGYVHFCPDAGFVPVTDADLRTHEFQVEWLVDWLIRMLPINSPNRRRPALVPRK